MHPMQGRGRPMALYTVIYKKLYMNPTIKNYTIELEYIVVRTLSDDGIHYQTLSFSQFIAILQ